MADYHLCTNIPENDDTIEFMVSAVYNIDGGIVANLRNVVINMIIDADLLGGNHDDCYSDKLITRMADRQL